MARVSPDDEMDDDVDDSAEERAEESPRRKVRRPKPKQKSITPPKPRRRGRWLFYFLLLCGFVAGAPLLVAETPARNYLLKLALPRYKGHSSVDGATLSWWKPIAFEGVSITGVDGEELLSVPKITGDRSLWDLVREPTKLGTFRIESPLVKMTIRPGGSNLEDALSPLIESRSKKRSLPFQYRLEATDAKLEFVSDESSHRASIEEVTITLDSSADPRVGLRLKADGTVAGIDGKPGGRLELDLELAETDAADNGQPATDSPPQMLKGNVRAIAVALESLEPVWKRVEATMELGGELQADLRLRGEFGEKTEQMRIGVGGTANVDEWRCRADQWLKGDRLRLDQVKWIGSIEQTSEALIADHVVLTTEPVRIEANGAFPLQVATDSGSWARSWKTIASRDYTLNAEANLAQLASLLPRALRIRDDVEITAGSGKLTLRSLEENGERVITADLQTTDLAARTTQGSFTWPEPLQAALTARMATDGPVIDRLACRASFLELAGKGTLRQARILGKVDLNRFTADVGRVLDLREFQVSGRMTADAECRQAEDDRILASGRLFLDDFVWAAPGRDPFRERQLKVEFAGDVAAQDLTPTKLLAASLKVTGENDSFTTELVRPVMLAEVREHQGDVPLKATLIGPLSLWQQRISPWKTFSDWKTSGDADLSATMAWNTSDLHISELQGTIRNLEASHPEFAFREQWVQLTGAGAWNSSQRRLTVDELLANGSSLSAKAEKVTISMSDAAPLSMVGNIAFRGDLTRLIGAGSAIGGTAPNVARTRIGGQVTGRLRASQQGEVIHADGEVRIADAVLIRTTGSPAARGGGAAAPRATVNQPQEQPLGDVVILMDGQYDRAADSLSLKAFSVSSNPLNVEATGTVSKLMVEPWADVSGKLNYDWQTIQGWVSALAGSGVQLSGRQSDVFSYRGPLSSATPVATDRRVNADIVSLIPDSEVPFGEPDTSAGARIPSPWERALGQANTGWDKADVYGLPVEMGQVNLRLADGILRAEGLDIAASGGRLSLSPRVLLNHDPVTMVHEKARVADNVRFSPEMCRQWVKYVAPLLADSTEIDGRFTLDLKNAVVPVSDPAKSDVAGMLVVPRADVRPGPVASQIIQVARQIEVLLKRRNPDRVSKPAESFLVLRDQNVEFRMLEGRVHHRGLEILVGEDVTVRTRGSVGLDDTIDLVVEIPVLDDWIRRDKILASLQGQVLQIPIRGTLTRPQVDVRAFDDVARRLASGTVTKGIQDELSRQLDNLLRRPK